MGQYDFAGAVTTFSALAAAHPPTPASASTSPSRASTAKAESDAAEAERLLTTLVTDATVGTRAKYALGLLRLHAGRDAEAAAVLTEVASSVPADPYPAYFAGQALLASAPEQALAWFDKAQALNPQLRSAAYGAFQALQRLGRPDEAAPRLAQFQALERDPRAEMAEFKYTRMGPLAMAFTLDEPAAAPNPPAAIAATAFTAARPIPLPAPGRRAWRAATPGAITVVDLNGDGEVDLFLANARHRRHRPTPCPMNDGDSSALDASAIRSRACAACARRSGATSTTTA